MNTLQCNRSLRFLAQLFKNIRGALGAFSENCKKLALFIYLKTYHYELLPSIFEYFQLPKLFLKKVYFS